MDTQTRILPLELYPKPYLRSNAAYTPHLSVLSVPPQRWAVDNDRVCCGDCQLFERIDHPHTGRCAKGHGRYWLWDTDRRECGDFEAAFKRYRHEKDYLTGEGGETVIEPQKYPLINSSLEPPENHANRAEKNANESAERFTTPRYFEALQNPENPYEHPIDATREVLGTIDLDPASYEVVSMGTATLSHERTCTSAPLAVAWRYRLADNYGAGTVVNRAGPIDPTQTEQSLKERFGCEVIELEPAGEDSP